MNVVIYLFLFAFSVADDTPCKLVRLADLLDCSDQALRRVPENRGRYQRVHVLDMRYNNISSVSEKWLVQEYPNLKLVDARANPHVCDGILVTTIAVISDCIVLRSSAHSSTPRPMHPHLTSSSPPRPSLTHRPSSTPRPSFTSRPSSTPHTVNFTE